MQFVPGLHRTSPSWSSSRMSSDDQKLLKWSSSDVLQNGQYDGRLAPGRPSCGGLVWYIIYRIWVTVSFNPKEWWIFLSISWNHFSKKNLVKWFFPFISMASIIRFKSSRNNDLQCSPLFIIFIVTHIIWVIFSYYTWLNNSQYNNTLSLESNH